MQKNNEKKQDAKTAKKTWVSPQRTILKKELPQVASSMTTW